MQSQREAEQTAREGRQREEPTDYRPVYCVPDAEQAEGRLPGQNLDKPARGKDRMLTFLVVPLASSPPGLQPSTTDCI